MKNENENKNKKKNENGPKKEKKEEMGEPNEREKKLKNNTMLFYISLLKIFHSLNSLLVTSLHFGNSNLRIFQYLCILPASYIQ